MAVEKKDLGNISIDVADVSDLDKSHKCHAGLFKNNFCKQDLPDSTFPIISLLP